MNAIFLFFLFGGGRGAEERDFFGNFFLTHIRTQRYGQSLKTNIKCKHSHRYLQWIVQLPVLRKRGGGVFNVWVKKLLVFLFHYKWIYTLGAVHVCGCAINHLVHSNTLVHLPFSQSPSVPTSLWSQLHKTSSHTQP